MPIKYSLSAHYADPSDKAKGSKVYPRIQYDEIIKLEELARHIHAHGSPFSEAIIYGVLTEMVACVREQIIGGNRVELGELGTLQAALRSKGADKAEDFNPDIHVEAIEVNWTPSKKFKNLKGEPGIKWEYTLTRREMSEVKKVSKVEIDNEVVEDDEAGGSGQIPGGPLE